MRQPEFPSRNHPGSPNAASSGRDSNASRLQRQASVAIHDQDGNEVDLPQDVRSTVLAALRSLTENGEVAVKRMPEELTSTSAADILGVPRPTLMKWAKENQINSFKVGTHTRFKRDDVFALKRHLEKRKNDAFEKLRSFELQEFGPIEG